MSALPIEEPDPVCEEFDSLLALGWGVDDVLAALGRTYDSTRKYLRRRGREDLIERMSEWKRRDALRLQAARGFSAGD